MPARLSARGRRGWMSASELRIRSMPTGPPSLEKLHHHELRDDNPMRQKHLPPYPSPFSPSLSTFQEYRAVSLFRQDSLFERRCAFLPIHIVQIREIVRLSGAQSSTSNPSGAPVRLSRIRPGPS